MNIHFKMNILKLMQILETYVAKDIENINLEFGEDYVNIGTTMLVIHEIQS